MTEHLNLMLSPSGCCSGGFQGLRIQYENVGFIHTTHQYAANSEHRLRQRIKSGEKLGIELQAAIEVHIMSFGVPAKCGVQRLPSMRATIAAVYKSYANAVNNAANLEIDHV